MSSNPVDWFGPSASNRTRTSGMWIDADPDKRQLLGIPEGGMPLEEFMKFGNTAQAPQQQQAATPGLFTSIKRSTNTLASDFMNSGQLFTQLMQMPEASEYFNRKAEAYKVASEQYPSAVPRIEDIHNAADFGTWATERAGELVPVIASFMVPGGIAGKAVGMMGKSAAAAKTAGFTAGFLSDLGLMTGESVGIAKENEQPIDSLRVVGSGFGKAALDFIPFFTAAKQLGIAGPIEKAILKHAADAGYLKRAAGNAAVLIATEVPTETMQEWINVELDNYFTGYDGPMTEDQKSQLYNAAAGAALFGGLGLYAPKHQMPNQPGLSSETQEEKDNREKAVGPIMDHPLDPASHKARFSLSATESTDIPVASNVPAGVFTGVSQSGFDFRNLYDKKTGELRTTNEDYMRIVQEQTQVKYDPLTDTIKNPPGNPHYTTIIPGWQEKDGAFYLNAPANNMDAAKAKVVPGPNGFEAWDVYGASLGVYPDATSAMVGATNAAYVKGKTFVFDESGMSINGAPDGHTQFMRGVQQAVTPIEQAAQAIEQAKPQKQPSSLAQPTGEVIVSAMMDDAGLMKLVDDRNEFINNKDNYRTSDGEMKVGAKKKLDAIDVRIARYSQLKGIPNVNTNEVADVTGTKIDETLGKVANEESNASEAPLFPNLNPFEAKLYLKLNEKEQFEGLTGREQDEWQRLQQKIQTGETRFGVYREATKDELAHLSDDEKRLLRKVEKKVKTRRIGKNARTAAKGILAMRGVQSSKGAFDDVLKNLSKQKEDLQRLREEHEAIGPASFEIKDAQTGLSLAEKEAGLTVTPKQPTIKDRTFALNAANEATAPRPGWKPIENNPNKIVSMNAETNSVLIENENGTFDAVKLDARDNAWTIGTFASQDEAMAVAEGASPAFVAEVQNVLRGFWESFSIRPKLYVLSTADILNNKVQMLQEDRDALLTSHGIFIEGQPGTIFIHIDKHENVEETVGTLVHEMLGHFGLRAILPVKYWDGIMTAYAAYNRDRIAQLEKEGRSRGAAEVRSIGDGAIADILTADEAVAYTADKEYSGNPLKPFEQNFIDRVVAQVRAWFREMVMTVLPKEWQARVFKYVPFNKKDVIFMLRNSAALLRTSQQKNINTTRHGRVHVMSSKGKEVVDRSIDTHANVWKVKSAGLFLQAIQFAERYNIPGVADYMGTVQKWAARKSSLQSMPVELVEKWQLYNKRKSNRLAEALLAMTAESDKTGHALSEERRDQVLKEHGVDAEGKAIFDEIRTSFQKTLDYLENGMLRQEIRRHVETSEEADMLFKAYTNDLKSAGKKSEFADIIAKDPKLKDFDLGTRLNTVAEEVRVLRDREYFPYMRFGRYAVWVRAKTTMVLDGRKYRGPTEKARGQMIHFETFESFREQQEALAAIAKEYGPNATVGSGYVSDQEYTMLGMPPALYDTLKNSPEFNLTDKQKEVLKDIYFTKSPGQRFLRNMVERKGIRGFSTDAIRVYSSYMLNAASHIARIEHGQDLDSGIAAIRNYAQDAGADGGPGVTVGHVRSYWEDHYKYIMNPENDWAGLRAVGFLWYLGFNVKSAAVNMTQVPMVALPYLGARFGDGKAAAAITSAYKEAFKILKGKGIPTGDMEKAIQQGIEDGFLDESLATVLAGFSESSVLQRMLPESEAQRRLNQVNWAGAWMFRNVEKINRYVTFIAARKLALEKYGAHATDQAYAEAKEAVQSSMFEYAKWNRAPFMRGKKSVFFLFWSYMQGLAYLMGGGKGSKVAMRVWMMMLLAAGLQGVPFAENILDLIDWSSKEMKELFGSDDPYTDTRLELRKLAATITDNPDMLLHGWSRSHGLGPLHLLSLAGVPVPEVDISGSVSAGRWLPGTDKLSSTERDPDKKFGQVMVDVLGPVAGVGYGIFSAVVDDNPDTWKKWERAMPSALKSASQGIRRSQRGAEEFRGGGTIAPFDPNNAEDRMALTANMLGFQPTKVGEAYAVIGTKENLRRYWTGRHAMVMENWAFAVRSQDQELIADAKANLEEYNESVPDPMLRLTPKKIRQSMKARGQKMKLREMGLPSEKGYRRLYEEIDQIFGLQST